MLILGLYCYCKGSLDKFSLPFDSDGKGCGTDHPQHPYIYFPAPQTDVPVAPLSRYGALPA
jgi:hypothetical protein